MGLDEFEVEFDFGFIEGLERSVAHELLTPLGLAEPQSLLQLLMNQPMYIHKILQILNQHILLQLKLKLSINLPLDNLIASKINLHIK